MLPNYQIQNQYISLRNNSIYVQIFHILLGKECKTKFGLVDFENKRLKHKKYIYEKEQNIQLFFAVFNYVLFN